MRCSCSIAISCTIRGHNQKAELSPGFRVEQPRSQGGGSNLPMFIQVASSCSLSIKSSVILIYTIHTICNEKPLKKALGPSLDALLFLTLPTTHTSKLLSQPSTPTIVPSGAPKPILRLHPVGLLGHYHTSLGSKHCLSQWSPTRNSPRWWLIAIREKVAKFWWIQNDFKNICSIYVHS